ncbi:hypothetical protein JDW15_06160 [Aerococcaceae bacterium zg-ZJ1578]|uniref:hypothetical protein n=1 Tax=Aerococcaceae bacterium zg-252 TaxID=2796928 RepID=UPI001A1D7280|nr:hypothetical protein [Aerococcaceae bacterium zg-1578]
MNTVFKILIFISSFIPMEIMLFIKNMNELSIAHLCVTYNKNRFFWIVTLVLTIISFITLLIWLRVIKKEASSNGKKYFLGEISSQDGEVLSYFVTYIYPLMELDLSSNSSILVNLFLIIVQGVFFVRNNTLHFNVLLLLLGFRIYSDDSENIIISQKPKYEIVNKKLKVDQIGTSNIYYI